MLTSRPRSRPRRKARKGSEASGLREKSPTAVVEHRAPPHPVTPLPYLLDFYPLQDASQTRLSAFFEALQRGRFTTTRCRKDGRILWPPRTVCPNCHTAELEWVDLPREGRIYAFSALLGGAPLGMESDLPIVMGLVQLDGNPLRLFGRILGRDWRDCRIGQKVRVEPLWLSDGRVFYAFRVTA